MKLVSLVSAICIAGILTPALAAVHPILVRTDSAFGETISLYLTGSKPYSDAGNEGSSDKGFKFSYKSVNGVGGAMKGTGVVVCEPGEGSTYLVTYFYGDNQIQNTPIAVDDDSKVDKTSIGAYDIWYTLCRHQPNRF